MKKNKMMRLASVLLVCVLMSTSMISGTFAKYTSTTTNSDTARVAKWSIKVNKAEIGVAEDPKVAFDLFKTIKDTNGSDEGDVAKKDGVKIIAPGTSGSFDIEIMNLSEVTAKYTIALTETNVGNIPLQYSVDGSTWKDSIAELAMEALTEQTIAMENDEDTDTATKTVYWKWAFNDTVQHETLHGGQTDVTDTALGFGNSASVTIEATITVTQVD